MYIFSSKSSRSSNASQHKFTTNIALEEFSWSLSAIFLNNSIADGLIVYIVDCFCITLKLRLIVIL